MTSAANISMLRLTRSTGITPNCRMNTRMLNPVRSRMRAICSRTVCGLPTTTVNAAVDIWPYVDALDLDEPGIPSINDVHYVCRVPTVVDHVPIGTGRPTSFL